MQRQCIVEYCGAVRSSTSLKGRQRATLEGIGLAEYQLFVYYSFVSVISFLWFCFFAVCHLPFSCVMVSLNNRKCCFSSFPCFFFFHFFLCVNILDPGRSKAAPADTVTHQNISNKMHSHLQTTVPSIHLLTPKPDFTSNPDLLLTSDLTLTLNLVLQSVKCEGFSLSLFLKTFLIFPL